MPVRSGVSSFVRLRMRSEEVEMLDAATLLDVSVALILSKGASWAPASKDEGVAPI